MRQLVLRVPQVGLNLMTVMAERVDRSQRLATDVAYRPVTQRLARLLVELDERDGRPTLDGERVLHNELSQQDLAELVGSTRKAIVTALRDLRAADVVDVRKRRVYIMDQARLRELAEDRPSEAA
jgi:CRP-like cAMP-binding protein